MSLMRLTCLLVMVLLTCWSPRVASQTCAVQSVANINFGTGLSGAPTVQTDAFGTVTIRCTGGTVGNSRVICLALGTGTTPTPRVMTSGANNLNYQLHNTTAAGAVVQGSGGGTGARIPASYTIAATPTDITFNIAGRIASGQTVAAGTYSLAQLIYFREANVNCGSGGLTTTASNFNSTANIGADCTLSVPDVSFGTVTSLAATLNTSTNASVTCTSGASWTLAMNAGAAPGNTFAVRRMNLGGVGAGVVQYQIYRDAGPANIWGDGTGGTVTQTGTGTGAAQSIPIYLQVPGPQGSYSEGTYQDTVTATLTF